MAVAITNNNSKNEKDIEVNAKVPDGGWGWVVCIACLFGNFTTGGICLSFGIILPSLKEYFSESTAVISLVGSLLVGLVLASSPIAAILTNRFGLRPVYMIGSLVTGVSLLASTFAPNVYILLLTYGIFSGIGLGLIILPVSIACNYYFEKRRALATGIAKTGFSLGGFLYPPMTEYLLEIFQWKAVIYMYAGVAFISCFFGALIRPLELASIESEKNDDEIEQNKEDNMSNNAIRRHSSCSNMAMDEHMSNVDLKKNMTYFKNESSRRNSFSVFEDKNSNLNNNIDCCRKISQDNIHEFLKKNVDSELRYNFKASSRRGSRIFLPPLAKTDSFYDGSIQNVVENKKHSLTDKNSSQLASTTNTNLEQRQSTLNISKLDIEKSAPTLQCGIEPRKKKSMERTCKLSNLIDTWFWFNPSLMLLLLSRFLGHFSLVLFFMFLPTLLLEFGYSLEEASLMLTVLGITNTVSRIVVGAMMDHPRISPAMLTTVGFTIQAILQFLLPFVENYAILMTLGGVIGIIQAPYNVALSIILGEIVPMKKIASTFAKMALFQGIGSIVGPSIAGLIFDITMDIKVLFFIAAIINLIGGIACGVSILISNRTPIKDLDS